MKKYFSGFAVIFVIIALGLTIIGGTGYIFYNTANGNPPELLTKLIPPSDTSFIEHTPEINYPSPTQNPTPLPCSKCSTRQNKATYSPTSTNSPTSKPTTPTPTFNDEYKQTTITYESYEDVNGNYTRDGNETGISSIFELKINESEIWRTVISEKTDDQGKKTFTVLQPGSYQLIPTEITFYRQPGPKYFDIDKNGGSKSFSFGYFPQVSKTGFKVYVFNDKNENGIKENDEENIHYQYAKITNLQGTKVGTMGTSWNIAVSESGKEETYIPFGQYKIELIPESDSWGLYYKITKQSDIAFLGSGESQKTINLGAHKLY